MIRFVGACLLAVLALAVEAHAENDLTNCRWYNGTAMTERECSDAKEKRQLLEQEIEKDRLRQLERQRVKRDNEAFVKQWKAKSGKKEELCSVARNVAGGMVWLEEPCSQHEQPIPCVNQWVDAKGSINYAERPCKPGEQKTIQQVEREQKAAQKKLCGKDYQVMRIGMALDRYEECTDGLAYITETVSKDGAVEIYKSTFYFIHAKEGRIIGWTRRTH